MDERRRLVVLGQAQPGDWVRTGLRRTSRHVRRYSQVEHLAVVDHRYGHSAELLYVRTLCGAAAGTSATAESTRLCRACERRAEREGLATERPMVARP